MMESAPGGDWQQSFEALPPPPSEAESLPGFWLADRQAVGESPGNLDPAPPGYQLLGRLGRGAMGDVLLARDGRLNRLVALKMIRGDAAGPQWRDRFLAEARAVARLRHPNIVQIYEVGETNSRPYLALEYVAGGSLRDRLAAGTLQPRAAAELTRSLADAVQHAHDHGLIHRDLKPANILLQASRESGAGNRDAAENPSPAARPRLPNPDSLLPKIADFGLATTIGGASGVAGTPSYMAPEQADAATAGSVGPRADIYALGAVLYECLSGRPPIQTGSTTETLERLRTAEPAPLPSAVPRDLDAVCCRCLEKDPARRYRSAMELADDLGRYLRGEPVAARPVGWLERTWKWARRRPIVATLSGMLLIAVVGGIVGSLIYQARLSDALRQSDRHRARSDSNYQKALAAVERLLTRVGEQGLANVPQMDAVRAELLNDALRFYLGFLAEADESDTAIRWETALAHVRVARIEAYLGRAAAAASHYRQAIGRLEALAASEPRRAQYRAALADAHQRLADHLARGSSAADAGEHFERAAAIWIDLVAGAADSTEFRSSQATGDHLRGRWHKDAGRMADAEATYRLALARRREVVERRPEDLDARRDLAMTLHNLASLEVEVHRVADAARDEAEAVALFAEVARARPDDTECRGFWSAGLYNLGVIRSWQRQWEEARRYQEQALELRAAIARAHPLAPDHQAAWAQSLAGLAALEIECRRPRAAEPHARQAVAIIDQLIHQFSGSSGREAALLGAQTNLALILQGTGQSAEAGQVYDRAVGLAERLAGNQPENPHHLTALAALCLNRGGLEREQGRPREALPWFDRSLRAAEAALAVDPRLSEAHLWKLNAHGGRAQTFEALRDHSAAVRDWDEVVAAAPEADRLDYRLLRATALARAGENPRLEAETAELAGLVQDVPSLLHLAEVCAAARPRTDALSRRAASLVRRALAGRDLRQTASIVWTIMTSPDLRRLPLTLEAASGAPPRP